MPLDIKKLIEDRSGENYELHDAYVNRTLVKVLRTIGFDKCYTRAEGCYLYDKEGNDYLDFLSGYGVYNIGRNHPAVKQVLRDLLDLDMPNMVQMDCALLSGLLAEELAKHTGPALDSFFFCNSGTESVEGALKFARAATGKPRLLSSSGSYHGLSFGSLSVTNNGNFQKGFGPFLPGAEGIEFGDIHALEHELKKGDVACYITELVQGKGVHIAPGDFYKKAQELCHQYGALFIADEVQTGLGRTGALFAFRHWGLDPDIVTMAKALSGGFVPAAAFATRREIYQKVFSTLDRCVVHSTTFGRNNLAMACGLATLKVLEEEKIVENAAKRGDQLIGALRNLQSKYDIIKEVRGKGLMIAIEFQEPSSLKMKLAWKAIHAVDKGLFAQMLVTPLLTKHRILSQVAGHHMDVLKILPPLTIGDREIERFINGLEDVINDLTKLPGPIWDFGANLVKAAVSSGYGKR